MTEEAPSFTSRSATFIGSFALLGRVVERLAVFGQIVVVASVFGAALDADQYFIASIVPLTLGSVVGEAVSGTVLQAFVRRKRGHDLDRLLSGTLWLTTLLLLGLLAAYLAVTVPVVKLVEPVGSSTLGPWLAFAPLLVLVGLSAYFAAVLLLHERYVWPPLRTASATLAGLAFMGVALAFTRDVTWIAASVTAGYATSLVLLLGETTRATRLGAFLRPERSSLRSALALRGRLGSPILSGVLGGQVFVLIERALAASLTTGAVATLSFARGIAFTPNVLSSAIATGLYPGLLRAYAAGDLRFVRDTFVRGLKITLLVSAVVAAFFGLFGTSTIRILLERGAFEAGAARAAGHALSAFAFALFGTMLLIYTARVFYAVDRFRGLVLSQLVVLVVYLPAALLLRGEGTTGLASAFSLGEAAGGVFGVAYAARAIGLPARELASAAVVPGLVAAAPVVGVLAALRVALEAAPGAGDATAVAGGALLAGVFMGLVLWRARWPELLTLREHARAATRRLRGAVT